MSKELKKYWTQREFIVYKAIDENRITGLLDLPRNTFKFLTIDQTKEYLNDYFKKTGYIRDKGFVSTSVLKKIINTYEFNKKFILKVRIPSGVNGAYIAPISYKMYENEFLLDKDQIFIVKSLQINNNKIFINCDLEIKKNI